MCIDHFEKPRLQAVALKNRYGKLSCLCFFWIFVNKGINIIFSPKVKNRLIKKINNKMTILKIEIGIETCVFDIIIVSDLRS